jgi:hypothetical protein
MRATPQPVACGKEVMTLACFFSNFVKQNYWQGNALVTGIVQATKSKLRPSNTPGRDMPIRDYWRRESYTSCPGTIMALEGHRGNKTERGDTMVRAA